MELFKKIKNKLGFLALFALLFQLTMPVYQTYIFAAENAPIEVEADLNEDTADDEIAVPDTEGEEEQVDDSDEPEDGATTTNEGNPLLRTSNIDKKEIQDDKEIIEDETALEEVEETSSDNGVTNIEFFADAERAPKEISENIITGAKLEYKKTGEKYQEVVAGELIDIGDQLKFHLNWELPDNHGYIAGDYFLFKLPKQFDSSNIRPGTFDDYGTFKVIEDDILKLTFNEKIQSESQITGDFWAELTLDEDEIESTEETIDIILNSEDTKKIIVNIKPKTGLTIKKDGKTVGEKFNAKEIEWTVLINTKRDTIEDVFIVDQINDGQELITESVKLVEIDVNPVTGKWILSSEKETEYQKITLNDRELKLGLGKTNKAYKLTFKTKLLEEKFKEGTTEYENTAELLSGETKLKESTREVPVDRPEALSKTSTPFNKKDRSVSWTINLNFTKETLEKDTQILDIFAFSKGNNIFGVKEEDIKIEQVTEFNSDGTPKTKVNIEDIDSLKDIFNISINNNEITYQLNKKTDEAFVITYKTKAENGKIINDDGIIENTVNIVGTTKNGYSSQKVSQQVGRKTFEKINYANKTIDWKIVVNSDEQTLNEFKLMDDFSGSGQTLVDGSIEIQPDKNKNDELIEAIPKENGFEINFGTIKEKYTITYTTKYVYDFNGKKTPDFQNTASINYKTSENEDDLYTKDLSDDKKPNQATKDNGIKKGEVNEEDKKITWTIDINYNQLVLTNAKLEDMLSDNQELIDGKDGIKIYKTKILPNGDVDKDNLTDVTDSYKEKITVNGNEIEVAFGEITQSYRVKFKTKDKDGVYNKTEGGNEYKNTAIFIPREGEKHKLSDSVEFEEQGNFLEKEGTHDKENWKIDWEVNVNKSLSTIDNVKLIDELGLGQILLEDTIKVTKAGSTDPLVEGDNKDYKLILSENGLTIEFNGEITEAYKVTYSSYITTESTTELTNDARVESTTEVVGTTTAPEKVEVIIYASGGSATGTTGGLILEKSEADSERALKGVSFKLLKKIGNKDIVVREGLTDVHGKLEWKGLKYGDYTLEETIPEGYEIDTEEYEIDDNKATRTVTIDGKDSDGIKVLPVVNIRKTGKVKIVKKDASTKQVLKGAEFTIKNQTTKQEYTFTTNDKGEISEVVPYGEYTVKEIKAPNGYRVTENIPNVNVEIDKTTTREVENMAYVDVEGQKIWYVDEGKELPTEIIVELYADDEKIDKQTVTKDNDWKYSFKDLVKYDVDNVKIPYTIQEVTVDGYIVEEIEVDRDEAYIYEYNLTNIESTDISGTKTWMDDSNATGKRPTSIEVDLIGTTEVEAADEEENSVKEVITQSITTNAGKDWQYEFTNLPKYTKDGMKITYEVNEVVEGYDTTYDGFNITNTRANDLEINGEKIWKDANVGSRPAKIEVELYRQLKGEEDVRVVDTKTVTPDEDGKWFYDFETRPQFNEEGVEYTYSVKEKEVPSGYRSSVEGYDIINLRVGSTSISGIKRWQDDTADDRPDSIMVNLLRNGQIVQSKKVTAGDNWTYAFTNLSMYDSNGKYYSYGISEDKVPGYVSTVQENDIINTRSEKTAIEITKSWLDDNSTNRPTSIEVEVYRNDELFDTVTLSAADAWSYQLTDLESFDEEGQTYTYTIEEEAVDGYKASVEDFDITNLRIGTTEVNVLKNWVNDEKESRPETIEVDLLRNDKVIETIILSESTDWKYTFTDLAEFDQEGKAYEYSVQEKPVKGYQVRLEETDAGFEITNTYLRLEEGENGSKPTTPGTGEEKSKPTTPGTGENGSKPIIPGKGENGGAKQPENSVEGHYAPDGTWLPKTGETSNNGLYLVGSLLILGGLFIGKRRIKE